MKPNFLPPTQFVWNVYQCYILLGYPYSMASKKAWKHLENLSHYDARGFLPESIDI